MASTTSKCLFQFVSNMYGKGKQCILPNNVSISNMPELFNNFFISKISKIRSDLDASNICVMSSSLEDTITTYEPMSSFTKLSLQDVKAIILSSPCKSCCLDPLPTQFVFNHIDILIDCMTSIVNDSLMSGVMPLCFRKAVISPLIKKPNLDINILKNYRPVSNLPFLSKVIEKAVASQINSFLVNHEFF